MSEIPRIEQQEQIQSDFIDNQIEPADQGLARRIVAKFTRAAAIGSASLVAFSATAEFPPSVNEARADKDPHCGNKFDPKFNTVICYRTKRQAEKLCGSAFGPNKPPYLLDRSNFTDEKRKKFRIRFMETNAAGCDPAGDRLVSYYMKIRRGPTGEFVKLGKNIETSVSVIFGKDVKKIVKPRINCNAPNMSGTAVQVEVKETWIPTKGWGGKKRSYLHASPERIACD